MGLFLKQDREAAGRDDGERLVDLGPHPRDQPLDHRDIAPIDADQHLAFGRAPDHTVRRGRLDRDARQLRGGVDQRSEEHTSELQSLMRISYAVFCLTKKTSYSHINDTRHDNVEPTTTITA